MFMVLRDVALTQLLEKVGRRLDSRIRFRRVTGRVSEKCRNCSICKVERSLYNVATLISEPLVRGCTDLTIYLVVERENHLYSTVLLDYIRSLYSIVIVQAQKLGKLDEFVNPEKINFTILPIHDWEVLLSKQPNGSTVGRMMGSMDHHNDHSIQSQGGMDGDSSRGTHGLPTVDDSLESPPRPSDRALGEVTIPSSKYTSYAFASFYHRLGVSLEPPGEVSPLEDLDTIDCIGADPEPASLVIEKYDNVMCCGTFDRLHFGHKVLLLTAFLSTAKNLKIGITASKEMLNKKEFTEHIQSFETRQRGVTRYIEEMKRVYYRHATINYSDGSDIRGSNVNAVEHKRVNYHNCDFVLLQNVASTPPGEQASDHSEAEGAWQDEYHRAPNSGPSISSDVSIPSSEELQRGMDGESSGVMATMDGPRDPETTLDLHESGGPLVSKDAPLAITVFPLMDVLGPSRCIEEQFAMIVTSEIIEGANAVNDYRISVNLPPWHIILIGFVVRPEKESDEFPKLSSSFIRRQLTI